MSISKERLVIIGKLIGIYREEYRHNTQNEYTQKRFCDGICSPNTLKSIEAGGLSRSIDVYVELLGKFDLKFAEFPAIDEAIDELVEHLYDAIEYFDRKKIELLTDKALRILNKVKNVVYYSELWELMKNIQEYFLNVNGISDLEVPKYINLIDILSIKYLDLVKFLVFVKEKNLCSSDKEKYIRIVQKLDLQKSTLGFINLLLLHYYFVLNDYFSMGDLAIELENRFKNENNHIRLLDVCNYAVILHSNVEMKKIHMYIDKIEELILKYTFPEIKIAEVYSNIASSLHSIKKYELSLGYYEKMLTYYNNNYINKYIYMADCQNRLGKRINIPIVNKEKYKEYPLNVKLMYKYFTLEEDVPMFMKQNFIMKKILPTLVDPVFIDIFRFELNNLICVTNQYKSIYLFEKTINEKVSHHHMTSPK